jgi:hypothetical protein
MTPQIRGSTHGFDADSDSREDEPQWWGRLVAATLDGYAKSGPHAPSLYGIAESAGLTKTEISQCLERREELLVDVLAARDRKGLDQFDLNTLDGAWSLLEHTLEAPGLVRLLVDITAASCSPDHLAWTFIGSRDDFIADLVGELLGDGDPWKARILIAAMTGLQTRWLRDPSVDVVHDLKRLLAAISTTGTG